MQPINQPKITSSIWLNLTDESRAVFNNQLETRYWQNILTCHYHLERTSYTVLCAWILQLNTRVHESWIATPRRKEQKVKLDGHGRARREAARRRKSECKVNLDNRKSSRSNSLWQMTAKTVSQNHAWRRWRIELRQLTVYEHFGLVNMRAINTGGGAYWTGGPWPALSTARPLWREKWDFFYQSRM